VQIDGKSIDLSADSIALPAGWHTLVATKAGYVTQTRKLTLKAGQEEKLVLLLLPVGSKPAQGPAQPCGKFFKRCN
jgi:hypothetical protein